MMSVISKLLGLVALGHSAHESKLALERFFTGLTTALVFGLLASMMLGAVVIGAHFLVYEILVSSTNLTPVESLAITFGAGLLLTAIFAAVAIFRVKTLFHKPQASSSNPLNFNPLEAGEKLGHKVGGIADAFLTGLRDSQSRRAPGCDTYGSVSSDNVRNFNRRNYP